MDCKRAKNDSKFKSKLLKKCMHYIMHHDTLFGTFVCPVKMQTLDSIIFVRQTSRTRDA